MKVSRRMGRCGNRDHHARLLFAVERGRARGRSEQAFTCLPTAACCSGTLCSCLCSTSSVSWETIAASSNDSTDGTQHCNRMVQHRVRLEGHSVEGRRVVATQWRNLSPQFCSNISSLPPSSPLPTEAATHCTPHCNQMDMATWCLEVAEAVVPGPAFVV